jgi:type VI secretion system protein
MRALLSDGGTPNLSGEQALSQVVRDIKIHQVAVVAGMQAALHHLLERFDPAALEARLGDASFFECVVPGARKVRNWDFYARFYGEMLREAEDDFQDLFARQFARAYEEQISKL